MAEGGKRNKTKHCSVRILYLENISKHTKVK